MLSLSLRCDPSTESQQRSPQIPKSSLLGGSVEHPAMESLLDAIPTLKPALNGRDHEESIFETDPYGVPVEQFRLMRRRLCNLRPEGGTVLITSPGPGDGKSLNANSIAWALAEAGHSTLLLELDLRRPSQHRFLQGRPLYGLVEVLSGEVAPGEAVTRIAKSPLFYLGLDKPAPKSVKLLRSRAIDDDVGSRIFGGADLCRPAAVGGRQGRRLVGPSCRR